MTQLQIGFLIYPGFIQLDVMGAYQVLSFPPNIQIHLIGNNQSSIISNEGLMITPTVTLANCPPLDVICVKIAQLIMEYDPQPLINAGTPETAGKEIVQSFMKLGKPIIDAFTAQTRETAKQLRL